MSILDDMRRIKRELDANAPPPMYAVKCHPATGYRLRQTLTDTTPNILRGLWSQPPIYHDNTLPVGQVLVAQTRQLADFWRMESQFAYWQRQTDERRRLMRVLGAVLDQKRHHQPA